MAAPKDFCQLYAKVAVNQSDSMNALHLGCFGFPGTIGMTGIINGAGIQGVGAVRSPCSSKGAIWRSMLAQTLRDGWCIARPQPGDRSLEVIVYSSAMATNCRSDIFTLVTLCGRSVAREETV
jgi:hypothetical protein